MSSEAKIAANRRNAQKSTGPRSAAGKARTRHNAFKHGLAAPDSYDAKEIDDLAVEFVADSVVVLAEYDLALRARRKHISKYYAYDGRKWTSSTAQQNILRERTYSPCRKASVRPWRLH